MQKKSSSSVRVFYPKFSREELVRKIREKLQELSREVPLKLVALFGSYASGRYTVASDIDLLVVYADPPREEGYAIVRRVLDIERLEPHVYSESEYTAIAPTIQRMLERSVVLWKAGVPKSG
jgi:hypothetical protein